MHGQLQADESDEVAGEQPGTCHLRLNELGDPTRVGELLESLMMISQDGFFFLQMTLTSDLLQDYQED